MGVLARDIGESLAAVPNTFSSWDNCMAKSYCKWPVIAAIILGSLIALSLVWCLARCLCCGVECCCACCSCFNACCPSPRRRDKGYEHAPPTPYQYQQPPPMHNPYNVSGRAGYASGHNVAQTATFEVPSQKYHEDALPAMPSWNNASSRRVEQHDDNMELDKMDNRVAASRVPPQAQHERLLNQNSNHSTAHETGSTANLDHRGQETASIGDIGYMGAGHAQMHAQSYQDYDQQRQQVTSPYGSQRGATGYYTGAQTYEGSPYGAQNSYSNLSGSYSASGYDRNPTAPAAYRSPMSGGYHTAGNTSPLSYGPTAHDYYSGGQARAPSYAQPKPYESSTAPPSYRSEVDTPISPPSVLTPGGGMGRKPVQNSWREV